MSGGGDLIIKLCPILVTPMDYKTCQAPCPWDFPGKNTGTGCYFLLQGIFLTQGSNSHLLHCRWFPAMQTDASPLSHQENPYDLIIMKY